jgi:hypothetical protein
MLTRYLKIGLLLVAGTFSLSSCTVDPNAPTAEGSAAYGTLPSSDMSDYFYPKAAGYTYVYQFTENFGSTVRVGSCDTLTTLGFQNIKAPNGDSLFAYVMKYRLLSSFAGRQEMDQDHFKYITNGGSSTGAFLDLGANAQQGNVGYVTAPKPKPVGTDTILAGMVGRVKTVMDDFGSNAPRVWQSDTIYFQAYQDSVLIWAKDVITGQIKASRKIFYKDINNSSYWIYGMWDNATTYNVDKEDVTVYPPAYPQGVRAVKIDVGTPDIMAPCTETKWFGYKVGVCQQVGTWWTTSTGKLGNDRVLHTLNRTLVSVTN